MEGMKRKGKLEEEGEKARLCFNFPFTKGA